MTTATPSVTTRVVSGVGWMIAWRMTTRMLGFISILVLAGLLKPDDFGLAATATAISSAIDGLSSIGVRDALVRLPEERPEYYDTAFSFQVARAALTAVAIMVMSLFAGHLFGDERLHAALFVLGTLVLVGGFENIGVVKFSRTLDFRVQFLLQALPRLVGFVTVVGLAVVLRSYWALIIGAAAARICGVAGSYVLSPHVPRFGIAGWRYLLHFSLWTWAAGVALVALMKADPFLLSPVLGTAMFGVYVLASEIAMLPVTELLEPACAALFPGFSMARRHGAQPAEMGLSVACVLALCTIPFAAGISATSGYLTAGLLGPTWHAAQPLIAILAWTSVFQPFGWVAVSVLSSQGEVARVFSGNAIAAFIKILGLLAVRHTRDLPYICKAVTIIIALESAMFIAQLRLAGNREFRSGAATLLRAGPSLLVTCAVLRLLPGTWQNVPLGRIAAILEGAPIGALSFIIFFGVQAFLWRLSGSPAGAEARLFALVRDDPRILALRRAVLPAGS